MPILIIIILIGFSEGASPWRTFLSASFALWNRPVMPLGTEPASSDCGAVTATFETSDKEDRGHLTSSYCSTASNGFAPDRQVPATVSEAVSLFLFQALKSGVHTHPLAFTRLSMKRMKEAHTSPYRPVCRFTDGCRPGPRCRGKTFLAGSI